MPPPGGRNAIVGAFFIAAVALAVVVTAILSDLTSALVSTTQYVVRFELADNAGLLAPGAEVRVGGMKVGKVTDVRLGESDHLDVRIEVDEDLVLHQDAVVRLEVPLLGTGTVVNFISVGTAQPVAEGGQFDGRPSPGLLAQTGLNDDDMENIRMSIQSLAETTARVSRILADVEPRVGEAVDGLNSALDDARTITSDLRTRLPRVGDEFEAMVADAREGVEVVTSLAKRIDERTGELAEVIESVRDTIDTNRPNIDRVLADLAEITTRTNEEIMPAALETVENARTASAEGAQFATDARAMFDAEAPGIRRASANLRLASDQAKLTMLEVRRSPWRLLQRPTTRELEGELIYDATRSFAQAASDLRAASESLISLSTDEQGPVDIPGRQRAIEQLHEQLMSSFTRYREAEQELLDRALDLGAGEPAGPSNRGG
ncbi:MAG: MlaD family protein [Phycisphaera sp.]|nr:MAG: MlaD family protein [Phycisphaera sp.]